MRASERRAIVERAGGCCEYCRSPEDFSPQSFSIEHVIPRRQGGSNSRENLALSCQGYNNHKYTKTTAVDPLTGTIVPLFHPRQQRWPEHFRWMADATQVEGVTPIGRATVAALQLNRPALLRLRAALRIIGEHPRSIPADDAS